eukprot:351191_1
MNVNKPVLLGAMNTKCEKDFDCCLCSITRGDLNQACVVFSAGDYGVLGVKRQRCERRKRSNCMSFACTDFKSTNNDHTHRHITRNDDQRYGVIHDGKHITCDTPLIHPSKAPSVMINTAASPMNKTSLIKGCTADKTCVFYASEQCQKSTTKTMVYTEMAAAKHRFGIQFETSIGCVCCGDIVCVMIHIEKCCKRWYFAQKRNKSTTNCMKQQWSKSRSNTMEKAMIWRRRSAEIGKRRGKESLLWRPLSFDYL